MTTPEDPTPDPTADAVPAPHGNPDGSVVTQEPTRAPQADAPGTGGPARATDEPASATDEPAFDVEELPGGAAAALEAVLMVADEPLSAVRLATALGLATERVESLLADLAREYAGDDGAHRPRGFVLRHVADGWRFYSAPAHADVVARFVLDGQTARLTHAALETLAVIAYRQPVTRGQVSAVRGVNVDSVVRTLVARGLVAEQGTEPSGAVLYGTTPYFLERLGMTSLDELPPLAPYLPDLEGLDVDGEGLDRRGGGRS